MACLLTPIMITRHPEQAMGSPNSWPALRELPKGTDIWMSGAAQGRVFLQVLSMRTAAR